MPAVGLIEGARSIFEAEQHASRAEWNRAVADAAKQVESLQATSRSLQTEIEARKQDVVGDQVEVGTAAGTVEEIGLIYTLLRTADGARFYVPNTRMASDTIRNATLQSFEHRAQITIGVPVGSDFERVRDILVEEARRAPEAMPDKNPVATLSQVDAAAAVFTVDAWARSVGQAAKLASGLRVGAYKRLLAEGIYA